MCKISIRFRPLESFLFLFFWYNIPFHRNDPTIYMRIKKPKALRKESKKHQQCELEIWLVHTYPCQLGLFFPMYGKKCSKPPTLNNISIKENNKKSCNSLQHFETNTYHLHHLTPLHPACNILEVKYLTHILWSLCNSWKSNRSLSIMCTLLAICWI